MQKDRFGKAELMYEGSVKRIFTSSLSPESLVFEFTDDFSVFDWGKMPDTIPAKGEVLAKLAALFFQKLQDPDDWKLFFSSDEGKSLAEALAQKSSAEIVSRATEGLQTQGLKTHFLDFQGGRELQVQKINVNRPVKHAVLGTSFYTYPSKMSAPFLIPLEVVFRFEVTGGSSFIKRNYDRAYNVGDVFHPPYIETFTKLEPQDRTLSTSEASAISGLNETQFEDLYLKTSLVAGILKFWFGNSDIRLIDGKLEWGLNDQGEVILVDAIGPDELRLEKQGLALSKELLRQFYRKTEWYEQLERAKVEAETSGVSDWKTLLPEPPALPPRLKTLTGEMYQALVNEVHGKKEFPCSDLPNIIQDIKTLLAQEAP